MYTAAMTPEEIDVETNAEVKNILAKTNKMNKVFRRKVLKATKFPVKMTYEQHTVRKNRWVVTLSAMSKGNTMGRTIIKFYCISESAQGKFIYVPIPSPDRPKGVQRTVIFKPHFFKRYRERMGAELGGEELVARLIGELEVINFVFHHLPDGKTELMVNFKEGQGFGESFYNKNVLVVRTFVPKKMLFDDQMPFYEKGLVEREKELADAHEQLYNFDRNKKKAERERRKELEDIQQAREAIIGEMAQKQKPTTTEMMSTVLEMEKRPDLFPPEITNELKSLTGRIHQIDVEKAKMVKELEKINQEEERNRQIRQSWWFKLLYAITLITILPVVFLKKLFRTRS